jgi:hypothetical protein
MNRSLTKIQKYDLEDSLIEIIDDIIKLMGTYAIQFMDALHILIVICLIQIQELLLTT